MSPRHSVLLRYLPIYTVLFVFGPGLVSVAALQLGTILNSPLMPCSSVKATIRSVPQNINYTECKIDVESAACTTAIAEIPIPLAIARLIVPSSVECTIPVTGKEHLPLCIGFTASSNTTSVDSKGNDGDELLPILHISASITILGNSGLCDYNGTIHAECHPNGKAGPAGKLTIHGRRRCSGADIGKLENEADSGWMKLVMG